MSAEKSRKAFFPFPFNGFDAVSGFAHLGLAMQRIFFRQSRELHANAFSEADCHGMHLVVVPERNCRICGFALMQITAPNGWILETCSAHQISKSIKDGSLLNFLSEIGNEHTYNQSDERSKVLNLQQPTN